MAANREGLRELFDNMPTRLISRSGHRMEMFEDPLGVTTMVVDNHGKSSW